MSKPTLHELMESPCEWTDYSCECIVYMCSEEIERLTADLKAERKQRAYERRIYSARVEKLETVVNAAKAVIGFDRLVELCGGIDGLAEALAATEQECLHKNRNEAGTICLDCGCLPATEQEKDGD